MESFVAFVQAQPGCLLELGDALCLSSAGFPGLEEGR